MRSNTDITLYNRYVVNGTELYQLVQILSVAWENTKAVNVLKSGLLAADSVTLFIPMARGTNYLKPKAWQDLDAKVGKWTLQPGDVVVKGLVSDTIGTAFTITDLKQKHDDVVRITSIDTMDMGSSALQHWRVGAA
jgi:hypothetical protein